MLQEQGDRFRQTSGHGYVLNMIQPAAECRPMERQLVAGDYLAAAQQQRLAATVLPEEEETI